MNKGFTLFEIMLYVAAIAIIVGISAPIYQMFQIKNEFDVATVEVVQSLRRAQALSQAVDGDTSWGLRIANGNLTLFKGASYVARNADFDEVYDISTNIALSGISEIVFTKFTGLPQTAGTITLTLNANEIRDITINAKGMVDY